MAKEISWQEMRARAAGQSIIEEKKIEKLRLKEEEEKLKDKEDTKPTKK